MFRNRKLLIAALASLALLAGACGGGDDNGGGDGGDGGESVEPSSYAADICTAVGDWVQAIQDGASEIGTTTDPGSGVEVLQSFLDDAVAQTDDLLAAVDEAGSPDVDGGEEFAAQLRSAFEEAGSILEDARDQAADLPTDDPAAFSEAATELGTSVQEALTTVGSELQEPEAEELSTAFAEEEACQSVGT